MKSGGEKLFFFHRKTNCGVAIGFYGFKAIEQTNKKSGRIFLVEATIDAIVLLLINIYNANTELETTRKPFRFNKFRQSKRYSKQKYRFCS